MTTKTTDPDLLMSAREVADLIPNAQAEADRARAAVEHAEAILRGETPPAPEGVRATTAEDVTAARLVELRTAAEVADMQVEAAGRRAAAINEKQLEAYQQATAERVRRKAPAAIEESRKLVGKAEALIAALVDYRTAAEAHDARATRLRADHRNAGGLANDVDLSKYRPLGVRRLEMLADIATHQIMHPDVTQMFSSTFASDWDVVQVIRDVTGGQE